MRTAATRKKTSAKLGMLGDPDPRAPRAQRALSALCPPAACTARAAPGPRPACADRPSLPCAACCLGKVAAHTRPPRNWCLQQRCPNLQKSYDQQRHRPRFERKATCVSDTGLANRILSSNPHRPVLTKYRHTYRPAASRSRRTFTRTRGGTPAQCSIREGVDQDILQN